MYIGNWHLGGNREINNTDTTLKQQKPNGNNRQQTAGRDCCEKYHLWKWEPGGNRDKDNKTQCQLCKRLAGPIIPLYWSGLVSKRVSAIDVIIRVVNSHFSVYLAIFGKVTTNKQATIRVIQKQAWSWPVKRQSFAIFGHLATAQRTRLADKGWPCGKEDRSFWCCQGIFFPHTTDVLSCRQEMFVNIYWFRISKAFLIIFSSNYLRHWYK